MEKITIETLVEMAMEVESEDPIDWGMLNVDEENAYRLIAPSIIEQFGDNPEHYSMLATITKLVVENFVLHLKLRSQGMV